MGLAFGPKRRDVQARSIAITYYTWYNGNHASSNPDNQLEYVFTKEFKRYAPSKLYPEGRFFDLRTDLFEEQGTEKRKVPKRWNKWQFSGLELNQLDREQRQAYDELGEVLQQNAYVPVSGLSVKRVEASLRPGMTEALHCRVSPSNATRQGLVWISSDPSVATVDKFGVVTAHKRGQVSITAYSWDDAIPLANPSSPEYLTEGIQSSTSIRVQ